MPRTAPGIWMGAKDAARQAEAVDEVEVPVAPEGIEQLRGGGDGVLRAHPAGEQIGQQVGREQQRAAPPPAWDRLPASWRRADRACCTDVKADARVAEELLLGHDLEGLSPSRRRCAGRGSAPAGPADGRFCRCRPKSTPQVSMPMASICSPSLAALFSACFISKNSRGTSQVKRPASSTGSLRKRCSSRSSTRSPSKAPSIARPLEAPKSKAEEIVVALHGLPLLSRR